MVKKLNSEETSNKASNHSIPGTKSAADGLPLVPAMFTALLCMLFGANAVAIKISLTGFGVFTTAGLRFGTAGLTILLWAVCTNKPILVKKEKVRPLFILATVFFTQLSLFYWGQSMTMASHGTLIANILPFVVMVLAHYFIDDEIINTKKTAGLLLGFSGVATLFLDSMSFSDSSLQGDLLIFVAVIIWGAHVVYIKKIIANYHPIQITIYPMLLSAPCFFLSGFLWDEQMIIMITPDVIKALFYQTFVTASFGFVAWNTLIQRYGATSLHSFVYLMPLSGVTLGILLLNEPLTNNLIGSIVLVVAGLIVVNRYGHRSR